VLELTAIEGVGPKTVATLYRKLKITNLLGLERAAKQGRISALPGMGKKTEANILAGIEMRKRATDRVPLGYVLPLATSMEERLRAVRGVRHAVVAGSVRRRKETVGDIDIVVTTDDPEGVMKAFVAFPEIADVLEHGPTKTVAVLDGGMHADIRVVPDDAFGAALQYFTGSKEHNVAVRKMAITKGMKLNEYGLWKGKKRLASRTEADVYTALGLPLMEPEIRTDTGELEAARSKELPKLIRYGAVRGDLQVQTDRTDGAASLSAMAEAAIAAGLEYVAITDHTRSLAMAGGLDEKKLAAQGRAIDRLNASYRRRRSPFRILKGAEVNIMKDGTLDIADGTLAKLDVVGAAVHSHFRLSRTEQTARTIRAMENPHVDILFHPTGRLISRREPIELDMEAVIAAAKRTGTALEIDAYPDRSDLRDAHVRMAVRAGVRLVIDTDAHDPEHYRFLDLGVAIARRGWACRADVLNTRRLPDLLKWLRTPKKKRR